MDDLDTLIDGLAERTPRTEPHVTHSGNLNGVAMPDQGYPGGSMLTAPEAIKLGARLIRCGFELQEIEANALTRAGLR